LLLSGCCKYSIFTDKQSTSMNIEQIRNYCLAKPGVTEGLPFNDTALVFKVMGKMFALLDLSEDGRGISLKCDPERAIELREQHPEVTPAWHFNKQHWNGVNLEGSVGDDLLQAWIDHSYEIVVESLRKADREALKKIRG
jgi:predicted DNA-binding protein (MmcQ/YjbR family)